ncbi:nitroreductase [Geminicoccaceae bacterium 1502E]|nr:nitroreductase [Geminicoccaceae bacterium 1502E]
MEAIEALLTRRTVPQVKMTGPGPDAAQLETILAAGMAAPDHGKLRPWRFLVIRGAAREQLGELFAASVRARPDHHPEELEKQHKAPLRAPLLLVVIGCLRPDHPKIPEIEQIASAAAAAQNMLVAAHALGFAGKWSTGKNAYDPVIREGLGVQKEEQIMGFLYLGSYGAEQVPSPRPERSAVVADWPPPDRER